VLGKFAHPVGAHNVKIVIQHEQKPRFDLLEDAIDGVRVMGAIAITRHWSADRRKQLETVRHPLELAIVVIVNYQPVIRKI